MRMAKNKCDPGLDRQGQRFGELGDAVGVTHLVVLEDRCRIARLTMRHVQILSSVHLTARSIAQYGQQPAPPRCRFMPTTD